MRDSPKSHLVSENAGPAGRLQGRAAVHLDAPAAERQRRDRAQKASAVRYRRMFETAPYGILVLDAETGVVVDVNPCVCKLLGYEQDEILEQPLWSVPAFRNAATTKSQFSDLIRQAQVRYDDLPLETKDGQIRHVELVSTRFISDNKQFVQCTLHDITERVNRANADGERAQQTQSTNLTERRSSDAETYDAETGLVNRWYLEEALGRELHRAERAKAQLTVTILRADQKLPEPMLREVGRVLREHLRKSDMASRYTEREFVVVLPDSSPKATRDRVEQIRAAIRGIELYHGDQRLEAPSLSAGTATAGKDGTTTRTLLEAACAALNNGKD